MHATSITGQTKKSPDDMNIPLLVRIARGNVQDATSADLQAILPALLNEVPGTDATRRSGHDRGFARYAGAHCDAIPD
eukprot:5096366-Pyramimonas_sp.AAC.1